MNIREMLEAEFRPVSTERPEGSITVPEVAAKLHCGPRNAAAKLAEMVKAGKLTAGEYLTPTGRRAKYYLEASCPSPTRSTTGTTGATKRRNGG